MDNKEILEKALERAVKNGYAQEQVNSFLRVLSEHEFQYEMRSVLIKSLLFDHNFCKAFFGEKLIKFIEGVPKFGELYDKKEDDYDENNSDWMWYQEKWQYNLQQMILEENPLSYIEKFLVEKE